MIVHPAAKPWDGDFDWPPVADGMAGLQLVAIARVIERLCGTQAAATYLAEALARPPSRVVFVKPPKPTPPTLGLPLPLKDD